MTAFRFAAKPIVLLIASSAALTLLGLGCSGDSNKGGHGGSAGNDPDAGVSGSGGTQGDAGNSGANTNAGNAGNVGVDGGVPVPGVGQGGNPTDGEIGARCESNADCRTELTCMPASQDIGGDLGGTPRGLCSMPCDQANEDRDCLALSLFSTCIRFDPNLTPNDMTDDVSFCSERCFPDSPAGALENKCHQRPELGCRPISLDIGFCVSRCGSDADCGDRFCDLSNGTCVAQAPVGDPIGASCDLTDDQCAGACLDVTGDPAQSFCSGVCTVGTRGCGDDPLGEGPADHLCLLETNSLGLQDIGLCLEACDCNAQCSSPENVCLPLDSPLLEEFYQRLGYCAPPVPPLTPVGDAGGSDAGVGDVLTTGLVTCPAASATDAGPAADAGP